MFIESLSTFYYFFDDDTAVFTSTHHNFFDDDDDKGFDFDDKSMFFDYVVHYFSWFCTAHGRQSLYCTIGAHFSLNCPFPLGDLDPI